MSQRLRIIFLAGLLFSIFPGVSRADDCGARGYDGGTAILKFDCEPAGTNPASPLQVRTPSGEIRGIKLVDTTAPAASKFRVRYKDTSISPSVDTIKAIAFISPGISSCEELQMIGYHPSYPLNGTYNLGTDVNCSATNPYLGDPALQVPNPAHAASLWGMGYAARFPNGFDGVPGGGDDPSSDPGTPTALETALSQTNLGAKGFMPMGTTYSYSFKGILDGNGNAITGFFINRPPAARPKLLGTGLFVYTQGAIIRNIGLVDGHIIGDTYVGGFVAIHRASITNVYNTGSVSGNRIVGGLVGWCDSSISNSYNTGTISAPGGTGGGLIGYLNVGTLTRSYNAGIVSGANTLGGLAGYHGGASSITDSYNAGAVSSTGNDVGGLAGYDLGPITSSYNTGSVSGIDRVGGLAGYGLSSIITNSYNTGSVNGRYNVGGIAGYTKFAYAVPGSPTISRSYNRGIVQGALSVGGLIGYSKDSEIYNSFSVGVVTGGCSGGLIGTSINYNCFNCAWDTNTSPHVIEDRDAEGYLDFLEMGQGWNENSAAVFNGSSHAVYTTGSTAWDFTTAWNSSAGALPRLKWEQ